MAAKKQTVKYTTSDSRIVKVTVNGKKPLTPLQKEKRRVKELETELEQKQEHIHNINEKFNETLADLYITRNQLERSHVTIQEKNNQIYNQSRKIQQLEKAISILHNRDLKLIEDFTNQYDRKPTSLDKPHIIDLQKASLRETLDMIDRTVSNQERKKNGN